MREERIPERRVLQMSTKVARTWFIRAIDAEARSLKTRSAAKRRMLRWAAFEALTIAASLGERHAFVKLGAYYRDNDPAVTPDQTDIAEHWFRLGAAAKEPMAMLALGTLLMDLGRQPEGRRWLRRALAHGEGPAAFNLGREIEETLPTRALRLYLKGVALGDPLSALGAGELLEKGGSRKELLRAAKMYAKAARKRIPNATAALGRVSHQLRGNSE